MHKTKPPSIARKLIEIMPANEFLVCEFCGEYTWWRRARQRVNGTCPDCAGQWYYQPELPGLDVMDAVDNLVATFPGTEVCALRPMPAGYSGPDAGPCRACHRATRLYGGMGFPLCRECWGARYGDA